LTKKSPNTSLRALPKQPPKPPANITSVSFWLNSILSKNNIILLPHILSDNTLPQKGILVTIC
jgi:hypothetical protein